MAYESKLQSPDLDLLFEAVLKLETVEECYRFFEDLATIQELKDMGQRIRVAAMLRDKISYQKIVEETTASTTTIARVNKSLIYGADGYRRVFERLHPTK
jgi:TrpR-related protein YerC/YecD